MNTNKRLDDAFAKALRLEFDNSSKYVIHSDAHRGDNSFSDEFANNQNIFLYALEYYYSKGFTLIENGDGEELWEHAKLKHIRYAHNDIYEALKEFYDDGRYICIYGNHNIEFKSDTYVMDNLYKSYEDISEDYVELYPGIQVYPSVILKYVKTGQEMYIVHGHQGDFFNDQAWMVSKFFLRYFWRFMHVVGFRNPASPAKSVHKRHKIEKRYVRWVKSKHHMLIVGHTHRPKFSLPAQDPYFNSGCSVRPRYINCLEIEDGAISLVEWRIWPDDIGTLRVIRRVLKGPVQIENYLH